MTKSKAIEIKKILALNVSNNLITWMMVTEEGSIVDWAAIHETESKNKKTIIFGEDYQNVKISIF